MYGYECPDCGASLDPGEKCDCQSEQPEIKKELVLVEGRGTSKQIIQQNYIRNI